MNLNKIKCPLFWVKLRGNTVVIHLHDAHKCLTYYSIFLYEEEKPVCGKLTVRPIVGTASSEDLSWRYSKKKPSDFIAALNLIHVLNWFWPWNYVCKASTASTIKPSLKRKCTAAECKLPCLSSIVTKTLQLIESLTINQYRAIKRKFLAQWNHEWPLAGFELMPG